MQRVFKFLGVLVMLNLGISAGSASATPIVFNASPAWVLVPAANPTYVLPEPPTGDSTLEQPGLFYFNQPWTGDPQFIILYGTDANGVNDNTISDIITFDSLGPGGLARVQFFSDPNVPNINSIDINNGGIYHSYNTFLDTVGLTDPQTICCIGGAGLTVRLGSDRDVSYRPFDVPFDASDAIEFQGALNGGPFQPVPEPASLTLLGTGLLCAWRARRKLIRRS